jgi:hypothetical protein
VKHLTWLKMCVACGCLIALSPERRVTAQPQPDAFQDVAFLVGQWGGTSAGQPGVGPYGGNMSGY